MDMYELLKGNRYFEFFEAKKAHDRSNLTREELLNEYRKENEFMRPYIIKYENPFMHIHSFDEIYFKMCLKGDEVVVQEKIDGSNAHLNVNNNTFQCYSNSCHLNEHNHLQGFWYWCKDHYGQILDKYNGLDIYGEWLVPHHCVYPAERYGEFYVFDVMENGQYWTQDRVEVLAKECNFKYAPVLYKGEFVSWRHIAGFVGRTCLGGEKGEGVVVKNQTTLNSVVKQFYTKLVDVEFQETNRPNHPIKTVSIDKLLEQEEKQALAESIVTLPRVRKIIFKLIDSTELPPEWQLMEEKDLLRIVKPQVFKDCIKEEKGIVERIGNTFGMYCNNLTIECIHKLKESR